MYKNYYSLPCSQSLPRSHSPWATQQGPEPPDLEATALSSIFPPMPRNTPNVFHFLSHPHPKSPFSTSREILVRVRYR